MDEWAERGFCRKFSRLLEALLLLRTPSVDVLELDSVLVSEFLFPLNDSEACLVRYGLSRISDTHALRILFRWALLR